MRILSTLLVLGFTFAFIIYNHVVEFGSVGFRYIPWDTTVDKKPFSGITYKFHANSWHLYKIQFFWEGRQEMTEHRWFANSIKWQELEFKNGLRHGVHKGWYNTGKVQFYKTYVDDKVHGEFWGWHPNGEVSDYHVFHHGEQIVYKSFIGDGKPYFNYVYRNGKRVGLQGGDYCKSKQVANNL